MNTDKKFFMWSVLAALYPVTMNPQRVTKYADHTGIPFPVKVADISKFEKNNISINYCKLIIDVYDFGGN